MFAVYAVTMVTPGVATAQIPDAPTHRNVALVVDGQVQQVYRDGDRCLVQILVRRSAAESLESGVGIRYPAPGELVYVHVDLLSPGGDRGARRAGSTRLPDEQLPNEQSMIRGFLAVGQNGRWEASVRDWFEENPSKNSTAPSDRWPRDRTSPNRVGREAASLGVETQRVGLGRGNGLKVVRVRPDSAAARAGIEPGDVLVEVDDSRLSSQQQLDEAFRASDAAMTVTVRDVRTNREVRVDVDTSGGATLQPVGSGKTLGVETELAFYNGEAALKVTKVDPDSPAGRSGITVGQLILRAGGNPLAKPEDLRAAEGQARGSLQLEVVDPRERRERRVRVEL